MKITTKVLMIAVPLALTTMITGTSQAYYAQTRSLFQPAYVQGFTQPDVTVPRSYGNYGYGYGYQTDAVRPLIQGQLNFVSQFTYIPAPVHPYFYTYYPSYWGW